MIGESLLEEISFTILSVGYNYKNVFLLAFWIYTAKPKASSVKYFNQIQNLAFKFTKIQKLHICKSYVFTNSRL